jgi:mRNA interferase MazF
MSKAYVPDRNDIIWLDFEPTKGQEIGKYRPTLVLSSKSYNQQTGLLICCPISTSIRGGATEVLINNLEQPSVVAAYEKIPTFCRNCVRLNDKP